MIALGDGCFRATVVLPHHAAGSWPIQLVGLIVEHLTCHVDGDACCGPQHIDSIGSTWVVGFFVSQSVSLQRRMRTSLRPQDRCASSLLRRLDGAAGLRMAKREAGFAMAPRPGAL